MGQQVILEILADQAMAEEVSQKGIAEIALRRADAKFKSMNKCRILGDPVSKEAVPEKVISTLKSINAQNSMDIQSVRKAMRSIERRSNTLSITAKKMASQVDGIYQMTNSVMNISYLNTGLTLANTAMDAAGFVMVAEKLNELNIEVQSVGNKISQVANVQKNEKIAMCQKLIMQCNTMAAKIKDVEEIDLDRLEALLIELRAFISEMIMDLHDEALGEKLVLKMVYTLTPAYTSLFAEFLRRYYFRKNTVPANYEMFLSLYGELENESFIERLQDYYFIEEKMHEVDVVDILNAQALLGLNGMLQIQDQLSVLKALETQEKVALFEEKINRYAENKLREVAQVSVEDYQNS